MDVSNHFTHNILSVIGMLKLSFVNFYLVNVLLLVTNVHLAGIALSPMLPCLALSYSIFYMYMASGKAGHSAICICLCECLQQDVI